jgi:hypothetical protein
MTELKICTRCKECKTIADFYKCKGVRRPECKECTIERNVQYQKKHKIWVHRYSDPETRKDYYRDYYSRNPDKFAEYRAKFRETHPDYFRQRYRDQLNGKPKKTRGIAPPKDSP